MFKLLILLLIGVPAWARTTTIIVAPPDFQSNTFQQAQLMHIQTQQQLQAQDQYRSSIMHQYSDRLKAYSRQIYKSPSTLKKIGR